MHRSIYLPVKLLVFILLLSSCKEQRSEEEQMLQFAEDYTAAWNSMDPDKMASFYAEDGTLTVNRGTPAVGRKELAETAASYMEAFPDLNLSLDSLVKTDSTYKYYWTFKGTNTGPGGTGNKVHFSGFEEWTMNDAGLVQNSVGTYNEEEYQSQLMDNQ